MDDFFEFLGDVIDVFESWYGFYVWSCVGYVLMLVGVMEYVYNIVFLRVMGIFGFNFG